MAANNNAYLTPVQHTPEINQLTEQIRVKTPQAPTLSNPFSGQNSASSFDALVQAGVDKREGVIDYSTPFTDVYKRLNSGEYVSMYETYIPRTDNQERLAQEQTSWDKVANGVIKFGTKTSNAILGGTAGVVYGIGAAINDGKFSSVYDNDFSNWLADLDTKNNYQLPNHYTKDAQNMNLGQQLTGDTANFFADKFLGGLSFTTGAIVSEGIWAWATGGASLASAGARLGTKLGRALKWGAEGAEDTAKVLGGISKMKNFLQTVPGRMYKAGDISKDLAIGLAKGAEVGNLVRFTMTSAGYEASVEALQFTKEAKEKYANNFENLNGRQPTSEELNAFNKELESTGNSVFLTNMAIVGSSNLLTMGKIFNLKSPLKTGATEFLEKKAFGVGIDNTTGQIIKQSGKQRLAKGFFDYAAKPTLTEGFFEEGLQGVTQKVANKWVEHSYDPKVSHENLDLAGTIYDSVAEQYGSKEGWVEVGLGAIIGIVGGARNSYVGNKQTEKELEYRQAVGKTFDQKTIQGELIIPQRLQALNRISGFTQDAQTEAKKGNIVMSQLAQNDALLSFVNAKLSLGDSVKDVTREVRDSLDAVAPNQWAEAGIENVEEYKKETVQEFERIAKSYERNKTYWQYMIGKKQVGEQNLPEGLLEQTFGDKLSPNQVIIDSLTWNSVRGENAAGFMADMQEVLTKELGIEHGKTVKTISRLLGTKGNLTRNLNSNTALYKSLNADREGLVREIEKLNAAPKETEGQDSQKQKMASLSNELLEVNRKIVEVKERVDLVASQVNDAQKNREALEDVNLKGDLTQDFISGQDLINLEENTKKFKSTLEYVKSTDLQRGQYLEDMMDEYRQAQEVFMLHQASSKMASEVKLENINTWVGGKFLKKNKPMDLDAMEWFTEVATKYQNSKLESYNKYKEAEVAEEQDDLEVAEKAVDAPNDVVQKTTEQEILDEIAQTQDPLKREKLEQKLNTSQENLINSYKKKIESLLKGTYEFLGKDIGNAYTDLTDKKPTTQEIERYRELKSQEKDTPEFKNLERKLQNWKLLDTLVDDQYLSIAEMLDIVAQHEKQVSKEETKTTLKQEETEDIWDGASDVYDDSLLQNTTASVTAKSMKNGDIRFSHLKLATIYDRLGGDITIDGNLASIEDLENLKVKPNKTAIVEIDSLKMTIDSNGRIAMRASEYLNNKQRLNMYILNPNGTNWTYKTVSEWNGQETVKIPSDFIEDINPDDLYELEKGDVVTFELYNQDGYNDEMSKKLSKEEFKKVIKIMVVKNGKNLSVLKAAQDTSNENLLYLREQAYKAYKEKINVKLGTTIIEQVYLGAPEIKMDENGDVIELPISQEASERVVKGTGFIQNGEVITSVVFSEGELNTAFLAKLAENNKDLKIPFIVIKRGVHLLAYPVSMIKTQDSKLSELELALQESTTQRQVIAVNSLIDEYNIETDKVFPETLEVKEDKLREAFDKHQTFTTMENFTSNSYDLKNLNSDATVNIDLDNIEKAISDAKIRISLNENFKVAITLDTKNLDKTEIEALLSDIAMELNEDYVQNASEKYLYSQGKNVGDIIEGVLYTNTLDDTPPTEPKSQLDKIRNMNVLRKAIGYDIQKKEGENKIPTDLKNIITKERLKEIDDLLKSYDRIQQQTQVNKDQQKNGEDNTCRT